MAVVYFVVDIFVLFASFIVAVVVTVDSAVLHPPVSCFVLSIFFCRDKSHVLFLLSYQKNIFC